MIYTVIWFALMAFSIICTLYLGGFAIGAICFLNNVLISIICFSGGYYAKDKEKKDD